MFQKLLGLRENPFLAGHHSRYVYPSQEHQQALAQLREGLQRRDPFVLISGEAGTGKTVAVYDALAECGSHVVVALMSKPACARGELLEEIHRRIIAAAPDLAADPETQASLEGLLSAVRARGDQAILVLDDAHHLDRDLLEELGQLAELEVDGQSLLQTLLVGRPELELKLAQSELRSLSQRIRIHHQIQPLSATETAHYIHHRIAVAGGNAHELFPTDTCIEVFRIADGLPREINTVAARALLNASADESRTVTIEHVLTVERSGVESEPAIAPEPAMESETAIEVDVPMEVDLAAESDPAFELSMARESEMGMAEPAMEPESDAEPEQLAAMLASLTAPTPVARREPEPIRAPVVSALAPPPTPATPGPAEPTPSAAPADASMRILPSWFDEVVERRQKMEKAAAAETSASGPPAPMTSGLRPESSDPATGSWAIGRTIDSLDSEPEPLPDPDGTTFVSFEPDAPPEASAASLQTYEPLERHEPSETLAASAPTYEPVDREEPLAAPAAGTPTFVPLEPAMSAESAPAAPSPLAVALARDPAETVLVTESTTEPIALLTSRLRAKLEDEARRTPKKLVGFGWLEAVTLVVAVAICATLFARMGLRMPQQLDRATASAPGTAPTTASPSGPVEEPSTPAAATPTPTAPTPTAPTPRATAGPVRVPSPPLEDAGVSAGNTANPKSAGATSAGNVGTVGQAAPAGQVKQSSPSASQSRASGSRTARSTTAPPAKKSATTPELFGIAVGTYLDEASANAERSKLTESTRLPSRVVTVIEDSVSMYRVVIGAFEDRESAGRAASDLVRRGLLDEARVVPLASVPPPPR